MTIVLTRLFSQEFLVLIIPHNTASSVVFRPSGIIKLLVADEGWLL